MLGVAKRKGGGRYRRFRARILARDVGCTEPACPNRSTQLHHDPALVEGGQELNPNHARGVCGPCHQRLSAELRERLGLPYSPSSNRPVEKAGPSSGPQGLARAGSSSPTTRGVARRRLFNSARALVTKRTDCEGDFSCNSPVEAVAS
jgi:hypothetical protein